METKPGDGLTVSGVPGVLGQQRASLQQNIPSKEKLYGGSSACLNQGLPTTTSGVETPGHSISAVML